VSTIRPIVGPAQAPRAPTRATIDGVPGFGDSLDALLRPGAATPAAAPAGGSAIQFSRHANARLESRGISLGPDDLEDLSGAVDQLARKGAKESLVLMDDNAYIVGVPDRRVITVMTRGEAVGNIFTNIDSTMVVR
jgi:flagellar operon protein